MRVFKTKWFVRFARKQRIPDLELCEAVQRAGQGLIDADLGGGVIKQRLARSGQGKSGGFRSVVLFKVRSRAFFVYGFPKNERDNIDGDELNAFQRLATAMLAYDDAQLLRAIETKALQEVWCDGQQDVQE
ncbi:MAG TPA: type II toxin-antitoxin system RelE/ParE family toxin [Azospirillum sp.]